MENINECVCPDCKKHRPRACNRCGVVKSYKEFHRTRTECIDCRKLLNQQYYINVLAPKNRK